MSEVKELGYIEKGTGKHQSNVVYDAGGGAAPTLTASLGVKNHIMIIVCATDTHTVSTQTISNGQVLKNTSENTGGS